VSFRQKRHGLLRRHPKQPVFRGQICATAALGPDSKRTQGVALNAEGSTGNRGEVLQLGADYKLGNDYAMYTTVMFCRQTGRTVTRALLSSVNVASRVTACPCSPRNSSAVAMSRTVSVENTDWITRRRKNGRCQCCFKTAIRTVKRLAVVRGRYHLSKRRDGLLEYRWLDVDEADDNRQGVLLGIDRHINDHLKIGVGYNFTDFSDDLTDLDY
jgi:predicted porin